MQFRIYNPNFIEPWTYTALARGIGGSETAAIEMATRLAARGHDVYCYTKMPDADSPEMVDFDLEYRGVHWRDLSEANLLDDGVWWVFRSPSTGLKCEPGPGRRYYLFCEDVWYPDWTSQAVGRFDRIFALCPDHMDYLLRADPTIAGRVCLSSNGVNVEAIEAAEAAVAPEERNPKRIIWLSSPDRGLANLLDIFERAREFVPDLELAIYYGTDNIEKICGGDRTRWPWSETFALQDRAMAMPGVTWHGRIGQDELKRELFRSGLWLYPTNFTETSCIACMEAQACGCIPITRPFWAVGFNVRHGGVFIDGDPSEPLVRARYVAALCAVANDPDGQERVRQAMMPAARLDFTWERWASQWELLAFADMAGDVEEVAA